jgi:hypothetical protein
VAGAGLILALTAGGIGKTDATAAVFVQRLFSAHLPPVAGRLTPLWMRRRGNTCNPAAQAIPEALSGLYPGVRNRSWSWRRRMPILLPSMTG